LVGVRVLDGGVVHFWLQLFGEDQGSWWSSTVIDLHGSYLFLFQEFHFTFTELG
jgi:hypothetical protein